MLQPSRTKHRKAMKGRTRGKAHRGSTISFGSYALQTVESGHITARQIEAARICISRHMKRVGRLWIRMFPDKPITKKPLETRMGHGKGAPEYYVAVVKMGRILYELDGVDEATAREALRLASHKLPVKTKFIARKEI